MNQIICETNKSELCKFREEISNLILKKLLNRLDLKTISKNNNKK